MNLFTKTGLLPALPKINCQLTKEEIKVTFDDVVLPAPFAFRPFSQYYNPYSNGCSILCNHPVDHETKETIKKAKEILERKYVGIRDEFVHLDNEEDVDDVFVPEVLFRKYTETDSRPPTPTVTNTTILSKQTYHRRCITPDPSSLEPEKTQLVLDLRRSLSQNAMNSSSRKEDSLLSAVVTSTSIIIKQSSRNTVDLKSQTDLHSRKTFAKEKQKNSQINEDKPSTSVDIVQVKVKDNEPPKTAKQKKKIKKINTKHKSRKDTEKEFKDLTEPKETQVSSYEETVQDGNNIGSEENINQSVNGCSEADPKHDRYFIEPEIIKRIQRELDLEIVDNEMDPQKRQVYEEVYSKSNLSRRSSAANDEIKFLRGKLRLNSLITNAEILFNLPRTFHRRNARFELPMNKNDLNGMKPLDYLKSHVYITNESKLIYNQVFKLHLNGEWAENRVLSTENVFTALSQVMSKQFTESEKNDLNDLTDFSSQKYIDFRTWCGICALTERIFSSRFSQKHLSKEEDPCHEIEAVDFSSLEKKLNESEVNPSLLKILHKIRES